MFVNRMEKLLIRMIIVTAALVVLVQALLVEYTGQGTGMESTAATAHWSEPRITFYLENYSRLPHLSVLINDRPVAVFNDRYITVPVQHGDVVSLDGTFYRHEIKIKIINISSEINNKQLIDKQITLKSNIVPVCTVKIK